MFFFLLLFRLFYKMNEKTGLYDFALRNRREKEFRFLQIDFNARKLFSGMYLADGNLIYFRRDDRRFVSPRPPSRGE